MYFSPLDASVFSRTSWRVAGTAVSFGVAKRCATDIGGLDVRGDARGSWDEAADEKHRRRRREGEEILMLCRVHSCGGRRAPRNY